MSGLFRGSASQAKSSTVASGVTLQSSVLGRAIPVVYGKTIVAPNLIEYGNFRAVTSSAPAQSGKGGIFGGGSGGSTTTNYYAALAFALCEGPIVGVGNVIVGKSRKTLAQLGFSLFTGTYPQSAWGTSVDSVPTALGYNGLAYIAAASYSLGTAPALPNHKVEVEGVYSNSVSGQVDADPSLVVADILTNAHYGVGFPSGKLGSLTNYQNYCLAAGLLISVAYSEQRAASDILDEIAQATNSEIVWTSGALSLVPRGDTALTGNGATYTPPGAAVFDLTDDDFLPNQSSVASSGSSGDDPVAFTRKRASDALNKLTIEYLDRTNLYAPATAEYKDQALIDEYRERSNGSTQAHLFALASAAQASVQLRGQRETSIRNTYGFTLDARYFVLDPMDIVTLTDSVLGLNRTPVRILEISENDDGSYSFVAEDYLAGVGHAASYSFSQGAGPAPDYNADPGLVNPPIIFEPPDALGQGLALWMALSGADTSLWGGAQVWVATDGGATYRLMGTVTGPARMGTLTATLASVSEAVNPPTVDQTHTLAVDLSESAGSLTSAAAANALALDTAAYVDGEYVAYATATLTAANKYDLTYLVRGAYGSDIASHASGSNFARLDNSIFKFPFTADLIGKTISIKFLSFNVYGGGLQTLADVGAYSYTITGSALASDLPNVANLRALFKTGVMEVWWDEIDDFRPVAYEIRKGASYDASLLVSQQAHPPFYAFGDDLYWVTGISTPIAGLTVKSISPASIDIVGSVITQNVVVSADEVALNWPGTFSGGVGPEQPGTSIRTGGEGDILTDTILVSAVTNASTASGAVLHFASVPAAVAVGQAVHDQTSPSSLAANATVLSVTSTTVTLSAPVTGTVGSGDTIVFAEPDVINYGGEGTTAGYYTIRAADRFNLGYVGAMLLGSDWVGTGSPVGQNILTIGDFLNYPDVLGAANARYVDVHPEVRIAQADGVFGAWQKFVPGLYVGQYADWRMYLQTIDPQTVAYCLAWSRSMRVQARIDHYLDQTIDAAGTTITFTPDTPAGGSAQVASPFNGGPNSGNLPMVDVAWQNSSGDTLVITGLTTSQVTIQIKNGGVGVTRTGVTVVVEGF